MTDDLRRRLTAEALGTAILVAVGAGAVTAALETSRRLDYADLGAIALAFTVAVALPVYAFGSTSGAHINPAVTVALALTGRFPRGEVGPYVAAQAIGGLVGALLIVAAFGTDAVDDTAVGATELSRGTSYVGGIVAEAIATFVLMTAIMAVAVDRRAAPGLSGLVIGLAVGAGVLMIATLTGGSLNPARTFGPLLTTTLYGGDANWGEFPIYLIGPVLGAAVAALAYDFLARPREAEGRVTEPPQGTLGDIRGRREPAGDAATTRVQGPEGRS